MATIGQALTAPEAGWKRYDDIDSRISYTGWGGQIQSGAYLTTLSYCTSAKFKFYGTKFRIIGAGYPDKYHNGTIAVTVDGVVVGTYSEYAAILSQRFDFEKTDLNLGVHSVSLTVNTNNANETVFLDAIDIDDTGYLVLFGTANLTATAGDAQATLFWNAVSGAVSYNVKRTTTAGGPYTIIANGITDTTYVDTDVVNGTDYYYVVTAVDGDGNESGNSNEASETPQAPGGHGLLRVTMSDSSEREYELTDDEISQFIAWCNRTVGTGNSLYSFDKTYNVGEFKNRKEYLMFEKIISFEVMELTK